VEIKYRLLSNTELTIIELFIYQAVDSDLSLLLQGSCCLVINQNKSKHSLLAAILASGQAACNCNAIIRLYSASISRVRAR